MSYDVVFSRKVIQCAKASEDMAAYHGTMSQQQQHHLNVVAVCHTHQYIVDSVRVQEIARDISERSDIRQNVFGNYK